MPCTHNECKHKSKERSLSGEERGSITIRMPMELLDRLREEAKKSGRSANAEIVQRLKCSIDERDFWLSSENRDAPFEELAGDEAMLLHLFRELDREDTEMFLRLLGKILRQN